MVTELITPELDSESIRGELLAAVERFRKMGTPQLIVSFGWACELPVDQLWKEHGVEVDDVIGFIDAAIASGVWVIGRGDVWVRTVDRRFEYLFCHESDVHFRSEAGDVLDDVRAEWRGRFDGVYERARETGD